MHQTGNTACDHPWEDRCRFGAVWYLNSSDPSNVASVQMPRGKYEWLKAEIARLQDKWNVTMTDKAPASGKFPHLLSLFITLTYSPVVAIGNSRQRTSPVPEQNNRIWQFRP
jgi:hypothetical protein